MQAVQQPPSAAEQSYDNIGWPVCQLDILHPAKECSISRYNSSAEQISNGEVGSVSLCVRCHR